MTNPNETALRELENRKALLEIEGINSGPAYEYVVGEIALLAVQPVEEAVDRMSEQPDFHYYECHNCEFDSVQRRDFKGSSACPHCDTHMSHRVCRTTDHPEGRDARKDGFA